MTTQPLYALLLDVDGPIASPITRTLAIPSIADDLAALAKEGIPVIFNTGRSDAFLIRTVMPALRAAGLPQDAVVLGICEKGATTFIPSETHVDSAGDDLEVDEHLRVPTGLVEYCRSIAPNYEDAMFFDNTKVAMVSLEAHPGTDLTAYAKRQRAFEQQVWDYLGTQNIGAEWGELRELNRSEDIAIRIDPTIISTDIEHVGVGKEVGADKAVAYLSGLGIEPREWRTIGDSRSDYAMADRLNERGFTVRHADVRPADGVRERPYPVETSVDKAHKEDEAGAAFLSRWLSDVKADVASEAF